MQGLTLEAGTGRIVSLDAPAASVFAADPRVAEVRPASPTSLFVLGVAPGRTTVAAIGDNGVAIAQYDVIVQPSSYAAAQAASAIGKLLPGRDVQVAARPNGLLVSGTLQTAAEADAGDADRARLRRPPARRWRAGSPCSAASRSTCACASPR